MGSLSEGLCLWVSLSGDVSVQGVSVQGGQGPCPGSRRVFVQGGLCSGVSVQGVSVQGRSLSMGYLSRGISVLGGLCPGGLCPRGSLSRGSLPWKSLFRGVFVQQGLCPGSLCPERSLSLGSLSEGLCLWVSLSGDVSVQGSLSKGVRVPVLGVFVQGFSVREPPDRDPPYGNEWAVYILLEYIIV